MSKEISKQLAKCPFCGEEAEITINKTRQGQTSVVRCTKCTCRKTLLKYPFYEGDIYADAVKGWNTRKPMDRIVERLEERTEYFKDCTKYGNETEEQEDRSYSTMMMYEVAYLVDDLIEIVKEEQ